MDSGVGLAIQGVGILLMTLLSFFMMRSIQSVALRYWTTAWSCLALALVSLLWAFHVGGLPQKFFYTGYFLGEYIFGLMFIAGCRHYAEGVQLTRRNLYGLIPFVLLAAGLPYLSEDFNSLFMVQTTVLAGLFATAFLALRPARQRGTSPGVRLMSIALLLLAIDFLHYLPVFGTRSGVWGLHVPAAYLQYTSIFDLILEILLGFGTMMILMEGVRREVEAANRELTAARDRLELIARVDPLTEALNRHAFHTLLSADAAKAGTDAQGDVTGCVAVIDLDNLKPINDSLGHTAGDRALRAVAHAVRAVIRADDMLFRWGGDEFMLLMFGINEAEMQRRLMTLNVTLADTKLHGVPAPISISVSHGLASFTQMAQLEAAIEHADTEMYRRKHDFKAQQQKQMVS